MIARRKPDAHLPNLWEFPGGKRLPGETLEQCVRRETLEEVGLTIQILEAWPPISHVYPERVVTLYPFLCRADTADARPFGCQEVAWVSPADLTAYSFPPANAPLISRLAASPCGLAAPEPAYPPSAPAS